MTELPRGIRNHNPGNIIQNNIVWKGMRPQPFDPKFVEFEAPEWGLRALMKLLLNYYKRYQLDTVQSMINRWAPPHENATDHYAFYIAKQLNVKRHQKLDVSNQRVLRRLAEAITYFENGSPRRFNKSYWYSPETYQQAISLI